jgi:hypothetical protein
MAEQHGLPVNHPLRPLYRFLAALCGLYILIFGIIALTKTQGTPLFSQSANDNVWVLGLRANLGFAILSIIAGAIIVVGALIGRNLDRLINIWGGILFMVVGMAMLLLLQTNANFFSFSMSNCVASFIIGTVLFSAGVYGKTGPRGAEHQDPQLQTIGN